MRIEADAVIPFPREVVFRTYRDEMPKFAPYLPNVRSIAVESRSEEGPLIRIVNVWRGGGELPAGIRDLFPESFLAWRDHARWDGDRWECDWEIRPDFLGDAVACEGKNRFIELDADRTRLEMTGQIEIDLTRLKGVPDLLAGPLGGKAEQFIVRQITVTPPPPPDALTRYLQASTRP